MSIIYMQNLRLRIFLFALIVATGLIKNIIVYDNLVIELKKNA